MYIRLLIMLALATSTRLRAHSDSQEKGRNESTIQELDVTSANTYAAINKDYIETVKPIFQEKCVDCHSNKTRYPWYYKMWGVKQLIDHDIEEAHEHLDISADFPFKGHHGGPAKDLEEIAEVVEEGEMPLWYYRILHPGSALTDEERKQILAWVERSSALLK